MLKTRPIPKLPPKKIGPGPERTWEEVLSLVKYPTTMLVLDFETYFNTEYSLRKMSTIEYVTDRRFEMLGLAEHWSNKDQPKFYRGPDMVETILGCYKKHYGGSDLSGITVVCQNARFDGTILSRLYGINPKYMVDLMGLANHWNARAHNGLGKLAAREGLPAKGDTLQFKDMSGRVRYAPPKGRKKIKGVRRGPVAVPPASEEMWHKMEAYANQDAVLELELTKRYLPRISNPHIELPAMAHTLNLFFTPSYAVDYELGAELVDKMDKQIDIAMAAVNSTRQEISGENSFESLMQEALEAAGDDLMVYTKKAKTKKGDKLAIAKKDPELELLINHPDKRVRELMAAKIALASWPNHIKRVRSIMSQCKASGGRLPVPINYHGAHTGRFSGGEKINLQNLGSRGHELVNRVREMLLAPPGYELVIVDLSAIESRVGAWIAGQTDKLIKFRYGVEIYCDFASKVLKRPIIKAHDGMDPETHADMKWARNSVGKIGDLACTYGGGVNAVGNFAPDLDEALKQDIVDVYRANHPKIKKFWYGIQSHFINTAKHGRCSEYRKLFQFYRRPGCDVVIQLPNGRELHYHEVVVKKAKGDWNESIRVKNHKATDPKKKWSYTWGGSLMENVDQAISRDILWEAVPRIENHKWIRIIHHVHDELIALVKKGRGKEALPIMIDEMTRTPTWAAGLPLAAEGLVTDRYGGH